MQTMRQLTVTLSEDQLRLVRERVESGDYPDESAVITDALLSTFPEEDAKIEAWLRDEVLPALEELEADPSLAMSGEEVFAYLESTRSGLLRAG